LNKAEHIEALFVDLDGSLIPTDLLHEAFLDLLMTRPLSAVATLDALRHGRLAFKRALGQRYSMNPALLHYRSSVIEIIRRFQEKKIPVILLSASLDSWVKRIARHLGIFDAALGSDQENLKGSAKLQVIHKLGYRHFGYIGDHEADHPVWKECKLAIAVNPTRVTRRFLSTEQKESTLKEFQIIEDRKSLMQLMSATLRLHQWAKNLLLALPFIAARQTLNLDTSFRFMLAFLAFSLVASGIYVLNDLSDRHTDRLHPTKKRRPIAAGEISIPAALALAFLLPVSGLLLAWSISTGFQVLLGIYIIANLAYSFLLKRTPMLDVVILSGMYSLRIFAGGEATHTPVSYWLLVFSTFFFMGLALLKRYTEVSSLLLSDLKADFSGRGYLSSDTLLLFGLGLGCSVASVLVFSLYLNSPQVSNLYSNPAYLWFLIPMLLYWNGRTWLLAVRKMVHDDPVIFALRDRVSWLIAFLAMGILAAAT
jgi:4-hydroxybenzoate polyprenyltransferase/phosphoserine phosphatase